MFDSVIPSANSVIAENHWPFSSQVTSRRSLNPTRALSSGIKATSTVTTKIVKPPVTEFFLRLTCPIGQVLCIIYLPEEQMHLPEFCMNYRYIINNNTKRKASPVAVLDLVKKYLVAKSHQLLKI